MKLLEPASLQGGLATMTDVARHAGVSIKSVSRVINNEDYVSAKLRAKVEAAIVALNYVPDMAARSLGGVRSFLLCVLIDYPNDCPNHQYVMKVVSGAHRACMEQRYHLRIENLDTLGPDMGLQDKLDQILRTSRADGFILVPPLTDNLLVLDFLEGRGARYSRIAPLFDPGRSPAVRIDDAAAAAEVAEMFLDLGHRQIGLVNGPPNHGSAILRRMGFLAKIAETQPDLEVGEAPGAFMFEGGLTAGRELLSARCPPTAIFATNDDSAAGVMAACAEARLEVPGDVSVCGFDDSWVAKSVWPYLTTVHQPIEEMAYIAARQLLDRATPADTPLRTIDYRLIRRNSVAPPR